MRDLWKYENERGDSKGMRIVDDGVSKKVNGAALFGKGKVL